MLGLRAADCGLDCKEEFALVDCSSSSGGGDVIKTYRSRPRRGSCSPYFFLWFLCICVCVSEVRGIVRGGGGREVRFVTDLGGIGRSEDG